MGADPGTLFPSNQFGISLFGETANGNVDIEHSQTTVNQFNTIKTTTAAPSAPAGIITISARPAFRDSSSLKPLATLPPGTGTPVTTKVTVKTQRFVPTTRDEHNAGGGGIQFSYFFCRYAGVALDGDFLGGDPYVTQVTGQLILRYPFEFGQKPLSGYSKDAKDVRTGKDSVDSKGGMSPPTWGLAPYFLCGSGGQWDGRGTGIADVGGGVEVRFREHWGLFCDGRWVVNDEHQNYAAVRAGVSYGF